MTTSNKNTKSKSDTAKIQKSKLAWNQCQKCKAIVQKLNNEEHFENDCLGLNVINLDVPFLYINYANLSLVEHSKDLSKELNLNKNLLFDYAFIHPSTLKIADLKLGDLILIKYMQNMNLLGICWPSNLVNLSEISLNKSVLELNGIDSNINKSNISFSKLNMNACFYAAEITVDVISNEGCLFNKDDLNDSDVDEDSDVKKNSDYDLVIGFLKEMYLNKFILKNQQMFVLYMGKKIIFQIEDITKTKTKRKKKTEKTDEIDTISDKLEKSNLGSDEPSSDSFSDKLEPVTLNHTQLKEFEFMNDETIYNQIYQINSKTIFILKKKTENNKESETNTKIHIEEPVLFKDLAGLNKEIEVLEEFFFRPFEYADLYEKIGLDANKGVLLFGPSGCGKTSLAKAVCNQFKYNFIELKISEIYSRNYNEIESNLKEIFKSAIEKAPSIIFIDDIDNFCSRKETMGQDSEKKILILFTNLIDQLKSKKVSLICTTNKIDSIDLSLRRPGRLDNEIEISIPNQSARYEILKNKLKSLNNKLTDQELLEVAQNCHGYVGSDLELLAKEAAHNCIKRLMKKQIPNNEINDSSLITSADLFEALRTIKPSAMKEITFDIPKVYWSQIGGQHDLKKKLEQAIIWPIKYADSFKRLNIKAPRGLLMYGPPGCSKTMIAKALATETGLNFIAVKGPELFSKWVGESERMVREIFRKARNAAPSIIFFDEIDAVAMERSSGEGKSNNVGDRVLAQLLNEMDGVENLVDVTIVAATNRPDMIDKALMRPGRLDRIVYVTLPDDSTRREIFELKFKQIPVSEDIDIDLLVEKTKRYSGAEIAAVCNEAAFGALDGNMNAEIICMEHFLSALSIVVPRTSDSTIQYFDGFSFNSGLSEI